MKILFVDYIYQKGHVNFNRIHIDGLKAQGHKVSLALYQNMARQLPYPETDYALFIPQKYEQRQGHPWRNRLNFLAALHYIKSRIRLTDYDKIFISSWDELTLGLMPLTTGMYLMCHGNAANFDCLLKRYFIKRMNKWGCHFIVFNNYMSTPFLAHGIEHVHIVSHGCPPSIPSQACTIPPLYKNYQHVIFHPSSKTDASFIDSIFAHKKLQEYLAHTNTLLVLRYPNQRWTDTKYIKILTRHLDTAHYQQFFLHADYILLAYSKQFCYQVSGISYEAVANRKLLITLRHPSLEYCNKFYDYNTQVTDVESLLLLLKQFTRKSGHCIVRATDLIPDYSFLSHD